MGDRQTEGVDMMKEQRYTTTPAPVPQVIYVKKTKKSTKETYAAKTVTVLGCFQILCAVITLSLEVFIITRPDNHSIATGGWCSVIFFTTGILSLFGARFKNLCLVIATMVMSIISSLSAAILLILSIIWSILGDILYTRHTGIILSYSVMAFFGLVMLVISIVISGFTCRATCCRPDSKEGKVYCTGDHVSIEVPTLVDNTKEDGEEKKIKDANKEGAAFTYERL